MWLFLSDSFLSIVDKGDPSGQTLLVRGRRKEDIAKVFPEAKIQTGGGTDYKYRARLPREDVSAKVAEAVQSIGYGNFKDSVPSDDRHSAYMGVWNVMHRFQK